MRFNSAECVLQSNSNKVIHFLNTISESIFLLRRYNIPAVFFVTFVFKTYEILGLCFSVIKKQLKIIFMHYIINVIIPWWRLLLHNMYELLVWPKL